MIDNKTKLLTICLVAFTLMITNIASLNTPTVEATTNEKCVNEERPMINPSGIICLPEKANNPPSVPPIKKEKVD